MDFDRRGIKTSDRGKTSVPGIWACGDVTGRRLLAHAATREGIVAVNNMFGTARPHPLRRHPLGDLHAPGSGQRGQDRRRAEGRGMEYTQSDRAHGRGRPLPGRARRRRRARSRCWPARATARSWACTPSATPSSEFIVAAAAMIEMEMCAADVGELIFPHPTVSEALKNAILDANRTGVTDLDAEVNPHRPRASACARDRIHFTDIEVNAYQATIAEESARYTPDDLAGHLAGHVRHPRIRNHPQRDQDQGRSTRASPTIISDPRISPSARKRPPSAWPSR